MRALRSHVGFVWPCVGLAGSGLTSAAATGLLSRRPVPWWWQAGINGHGLQWHLFWAGILLLCLAWLGLGWRLYRRPGARPLHVALVGCLWSLPLALGPPLFSLDLYAYLGQGAVLAHGLNPYQAAPRVLSHWHESRLLASVSPTWRHTTSPYGPLFMAIAAPIVSLTGDHVTAGATLLRLPELLGLGLLGVFVPRLARLLGADPVRATWLGVVSPLTLLYLVGGGHLDALMTGLMVAGVTLALERRPLAGLALCALAATIKLPAAVAIVMIGICWLRAEPGRWRQIIGMGALVTGGVVLLAGLVAGVGVSWISGSLFSTPETARMALTPSTAISVSLWEMTHHFGTGVEQAAAVWEHVATLIALGIVGVFAAVLCLRVRYSTLPRYLGLALLAAALGGPAAWPWYMSWGVALLSTDAVAQRSRWLPVILLASPFPIMAGGQVAIPLPHALRMVAIYAAAAAVAVAAALARRHLRPERLDPSATSRPPQPHPSGSPISHASRRDAPAMATADAGG